MANDGGVHPTGQHGGDGAVGGEGTEVAANSGIHPVDALAADLHRAIFTAGSHCTQQMGLRQVLYELHFLGIVLFQSLLGVFHNETAPFLHGGNAVYAAVANGHIEAFQVQKNMFHDYHLIIA